MGDMRLNIEVAAMSAKYEELKARIDKLEGDFVNVMVVIESMIAIFNANAAYKRNVFSGEFPLGPLTATDNDEKRLGRE